MATPTSRVMSKAAKLGLKTKRLELRALTAKDYEAWRQAWLTMLPKQNLWDQTNRPPSELTRAKFRKMLRWQALGRQRESYFSFAIFEKKTGALVGTLSAMHIERRLSQTAFLGYGIYNRYWGKGYGKEAVTGMLKIAFTQLKLHRMEAGIEPRNRRSILLARRLGLRKEGLKKRTLFLRGEWQDLLMYSVTCEELGYKFRGEAKI